MSNIKNLFKNKLFKWFFKHTLTVVFCALIVVMGIALVAQATPIITTIGEDIATRVLTLRDRIIFPDGTYITTAPVRAATIVVAASNSTLASRDQADFVADGVNDQVEIQAAIDALPVGGGKVLLTEGIFHTSAVITVNPGTNLSGSGPGTIIRVKDNTNLTGWLQTAVINLSSNTILRNVTVDANMMGQGLAHRALTFCVKTIFQSSNILIEGNHLLNGYTLLQLDRSSNIRIIGNHFSWTAPYHTILGDAIGPYRSSHLIIMSNTIIQPPTIGQGIDLQDSFSNKVIGNSITGGLVGIDVHGADMSITRDNIISGNAIRDTLNSILIGNCCSCSVVNNSIKHTTTISSIAIHTPAWHPPSVNLIISSNTITVTSSVSWINPIRIANASERVLITSNIINGPTGHPGPAIYIHASASEVRVVDNFIDGFVLTNAIQTHSPSVIYTQQFKENFTNLLAASNTHIVAAQDLNVTVPITATIAAHPDVPRNTALLITDANTSITAFDIDILGVDARGNIQTENFVFTGGLSQVGNIPFARITSVTVNSITGAGAGDVLGIGISNKLGLSNNVIVAGDVFKVRRGTVSVPVGVVDPINDTVNLGSITTGEDIVIWYRNNLNTLN